MPHPTYVICVFFAALQAAYTPLQVKDGRLLGPTSMRNLKEVVRP
jgi:hypothetical protein